MDNTQKEAIILRINIQNALYGLCGGKAHSPAIREFTEPIIISYAAILESILKNAMADMAIIIKGESKNNADL